MDAKQFEVFLQLMRKYGVHAAKCGDMEARLGPETVEEIEIPAETVPDEPCLLPDSYQTLIKQQGGKI